MPGSSLTFLVIGCGSIGRRHIGNLAASDLGLVMACEPVPERAQRARDDFGIAVHASLDEALREKPTAVLVCTPPSLHLAQSLAAARAGCHLFIEKPITHTLDGLDRLIQEIDARSLVCMVGYNWRFHPCFQAMKRMLDAREIGDVLAARVTCGQYLPDWHPWEDYRNGYSARRELGGGVLLDSHELEYLTWFLGDAEQIWCVAGKVSRLEIDTEDVADLVITLRSGVQATLHLDYLQRPAQRSYEFLGSEGTLRWSLDSGVSIYRAVAGAWENMPEPAGFELNSVYRDELAHFAACLLGAASPPVDARRGARVLRWILDARKSAEDTRAVGAHSARAAK